VTAAVVAVAPSAPAAVTATTMSITVASHDAIDLGQQLVLTADVTSDAPTLTTDDFTVTREDREGTVPLEPASLSLEGSGPWTLTITDTPRDGLANSYTVSSAVTDPATTGSVTVMVRRHVPNLSVTTDRTTYGYGTTAHVRAHLGATYTNRTVGIYAKPYGGSRGLLRSAHVDTDGYLRTSYVMSRRTVFEVAFTGDTRYAARTVAATRYSRARLVEHLHRWYDTSRRYHLYRMSTDPKQTVRVRPGHAGDCIRFRAQRRYNSAWHGVALSGCIALSSTSGAAVLLRGSPVPFEPYRLRSELPGTTENAATKGRWQLLKFTA
jgi:hypothetical protein